METKELDVDSVADSHHNDHSKSFDITIIYNGLSKPLTVAKSDLISDVLSRAIAIFGSPPNPHTLALFTEERGELQDGQTVKESGIKKHEKVLLRPSTVKAG